MADRARQPPEYSHTQHAPLHLVLYASSAACIGIGWFAGGAPGMYIAGAVGLLLALLAPAFHHLTVEDQGDFLEVRFGPATLFHTKVRYADVTHVELGRTLLLDGWGVHASIRRGWVWNLWGRDCVVVHMNKRTIRIGSDDAANLAKFLQRRIEELNRRAA